MKSNRFGRNGKTGSRTSKSGAAAATGNTLPSPKTKGELGTAENAKKKYNAKGRRVNGQWCASDAEAVRYEQLLDMAKSGMIDDLRCQVRYPLNVAGVKIATYVADFVYRVINPELHIDRTVVEEVKGLETPVWKLKLKLYQAIYQSKVSIISLPKNRAEMAAQHPDIIEEMHGKTRDFSHWIKVRWKDKVPD